MKQIQLYSTQLYLYSTLHTTLQIQTDLKDKVKQKQKKETNTIEEKKNQSKCEW